MKAHRSCPKCQTLNHVKRKQCQCGHEFQKKISEPLVINIAPVEKQEKPDKVNTAPEKTTRRPIFDEDGNPSLKTEIGQVSNHCKSLEGELTKLHKQIEGINKDVKQLRRWNYEKVYDAAVKNVIESLLEIIKNEDWEKLKRSINPLNEPAYLNDLGQSFFTPNELTTKIIPVLNVDDLPEENNDDEEEDNSGIQSF